MDGKKRPFDLTTRMALLVLKCPGQGEPWDRNKSADQWLEAERGSEVLTWLGEHLLNKSRTQRKERCKTVKKWENKAQRNSDLLSICSALSSIGLTEGEAFSD